MKYQENIGYLENPRPSFFSHSMHLEPCNQIRGKQTEDSDKVSGQCTERGPLLSPDRTRQVVWDFTQFQCDINCYYLVKMNYIGLT